MKKILVFIFMFIAFSLKVYAAHLDLYRIEGVYSNQMNMDDNSFYSYRQNRYVMDGRTVYCIEPGVDINTREYTALDPMYSDLLPDVIERISMIGYFGYDYPTHQTDSYFLAAQELVWESVGNNEAFFTTGPNVTGEMIDIYSEKMDIKNLIDSYYLKPSFDNYKTDVKVGERLILTDNNHVLSNYQVLSSNAYIDGDNLVIDVNDVGVQEIKLLRNKYDNYESVFYDAYDSQDFMFLRAPDVYSSISINGFIPYFNVSLYKTGDVLTDFVDGNFIYEERGLDDIIFGLYAYDDIYVNGRIIYKKDELVENMVTSNGYALSSNLPNGKYYLCEEKVNDDFILSDPIYFEYYNENSDIYTYNLTLKNERKDSFISLNKKGELFNELDSYSFDSLEGVTFGLYSHDDIYSYDNKLLVTSDSLINSFTTDINGNISINDDIPISSYYFKELNLPVSYVLSDELYNLNIEKGDEIISYFLDSSIINYLKKGGVVITKLGINGEKLDDAYFSLYKDNVLIYEGKTVDGVININNLPFGEYKLYEVSSPKGYIRSDIVYDFSIVDNESIVYIDVYNEQIPVVIDDEIIINDLRLPVTSDIYLFKKMISFISIILGLFLVIINDKDTQDC